MGDRQAKIVAPVDILHVREVLRADGDIALGAVAVGAVAELAVEVESPRSGPTALQYSQGVMRATRDKPLTFGSPITFPGVLLPVHSPWTPLPSSPVLLRPQDLTCHLTTHVLPVLLGVQHYDAAPPPARPR